MKKTTETMNEKRLEIMNRLQAVYCKLLVGSRVLDEVNATAVYVFNEAVHGTKIILGECYKDLIAIEEDISEYLIDDPADQEGGAE